MIRVKKKGLPVLAKWAIALGILGVTIYPIIISPYLDPTPFKKIQEAARRDINRESIQPGNMRIWSDPFQKRADKKE